MADAELVISLNAVNMLGQALATDTELADRKALYARQAVLLAALKQAAEARKLKLHFPRMEAL